MDRDGSQEGVLKHENVSAFENRAGKTEHTTRSEGSLTNLLAAMVVLCPCAQHDAEVVHHYLSTPKNSLLLMLVVKGYSAEV